MKNPQIKRLYDEANTLYAQAQGILKESEGKELPTEKAQQVDQLLDEVESKSAEAKRLERLDEMSSTFDDPANRLPTPTAEGKGQSEQDDREKAREKAFNRFLKHGEKALTPTEAKALSASDDAAGGFLATPQAFAQGLMKAVDDLVYIRQLATVEQIGEAESLGVLSLDSDLSDWEWTTELATGNEDTVKPFGKRALTPHPLAKRIKISNTLIRKAMRPVEQIVQERLAYKLGVTQEKGYMTGDGNQKPLGLFVASDNGLPASRDVTFTDTSDATRAESLIDAKYFLKAQYQTSPTTRWLIHRDFVKKVRKLKDSQGQFLWQPGLASDKPGTILDVPYTMSEFVPNTFTSGLYAGLIGDIRFYWIVDSLSMTMQVLLELYAETNQRGYILRYEGDGAPMLAEAFARMKVA